ncbi:MAG: carboxypeptidase regulatory-like domain-containing protein [Acidobacteriota bacterium]|nr:carboxypeptidase regulatory-like domain-containing protein [Acidobacteriota bacterium]
MTLKPRIWIVALAAALFAICGVQVTHVRAAGDGTLTGKVLFHGTRPQPQLINMARDPECVRENEGKKVYVQDGEVNENGTLPYVFVYVKSGAPAHETAPKTPVVLDQQGCVFVPHVVGVMVGQPLKVLNSDFTTHNVHVRPKINAEWNESQPPGGAAIYKTFAKPEIMIPVQCNMHPWMKAYIGVVSNPFYDTTGTDGTYTIKGLPPGTYTIEAWTATYGTQEQTVTVRAGATTTSDFTFTHR